MLGSPAGAAGALHRGAEHTCGRAATRSRKVEQLRREAPVRATPASGPKRSEKMAATSLPPNLTRKRLLWLTLPGNIRGDELRGLWFHLATSPHWKAASRLRCSSRICTSSKLCECVRHPESPCPPRTPSSIGCAALSQQSYCVCAAPARICQLCFRFVGQLQSLTSGFQNAPLGTCTVPGEERLGFSQLL